MSQSAKIRHLHPVSPGEEPREDAQAPRESAAERERALAERAARGDPGTWSLLYQQCYAGLFRQLRYLTGDRAIAEELAQETFAQAMISRARYDGRKGFRPWLHGIALNVVRKHWRKQRNKARAHERFEAIVRVRESQDLGRASNPDAGLEQRECSRVLYAALEELPPRLREAFILRELQGLSTAEAADQLGITTGNLAVRVTRARARIRTLLAAHGWIPRGTIKKKKRKGSRR